MGRWHDTTRRARFSPAVARDIVRQIPAGKYLHFMAIITQHVLQLGYDYGDEFEFGFDLILNGLERVQGEARC